jgi:hypothetical protein
MKFKKNLYSLLPVILLTLSVTYNLLAQQSYMPEAKLKSFLAHSVNEKLFVHLSRPDPVTGELLWFSVFSVDQQSHMPLAISSFAYAEILDASGNSVLKTRIPMQGGRGYGSIYLPATINTGTYLFRCYTSWMKNADPEWWFNRSISIINTVKPAEDQAKPVQSLLKAEFFPEGGHLVAGLTSRVAVHVTNQMGAGVTAKGAVVNKSGLKTDTVVKFQTSMFGMGSFYFKPDLNAKYAIILFDARGRLISGSLPEIQSSGYVMTVADTLNGFSKVRVNSSVQNVISLLIHCRGKIIFAGKMPIMSGKAEFIVDRKSWPDGISHLTIFNSENTPVAERLIFKKPALTPLKLKVAQSFYTTRARISLGIENQTSSDALYSVSVYRADSLHVENSIESSLLLTSDLHGAIESPDFYFSGHPQVEMYLDLLMMINGWRRFKWTDVLDDKKAVIAYLPEITGHLIEGKILDQTGNPVAGRNAFLASPGKNVRLYVARSDSAGRIRFDVRGDELSNRVIVQPDLATDSLLHIEMNTPFSTKRPYWNFKPLKFSKTSGNYLRERSLAMQIQDIFHEEETFYTYKPVSGDSTPFYGTPDERYYLDDYTRFPVMEEVMREYVKGVWVRKRKDQFRLMVVDRLKNDVFSENPLTLLDGVPVFNINRLFELDPTKISRLDVLTRHYMVGAVRAAGIVSFTSYNGDFAGIAPDPRSVTIDYEALDRQREFYAPTYTTLQARESRIPDRRQLLYFNPGCIVSAAGKLDLEFFSSDVTGKFIVEVNGLSADGVPQYANAEFEVSR